MKCNGTKYNGIAFHSTDRKCLVSPIIRYPIGRTWTYYMYNTYIIRAIYTHYIVYSGHIMMVYTQIILDRHN